MVVVPCTDLEAAIADWTADGYRLELIAPADQPAVAVVARGDDRRQLDTTDGAWTGIPNLPPAAPLLELSRAGDAASVSNGRAGMRYRDLLPARQHGRFIASHITIPEGGPVPDYVHHHDVRFQVIYCRRGWVRVVYEDQGPPFTMHAGDCVLQPPHIRHRVLESSPGLEVVEVTCPAVHATLVDHEMALPTAGVRPDREFGGQRFVHHRAAGATWSPWRAASFEARDTGVGAATDGRAGARVVRPTSAGVASSATHHDGELLLWFVTAGAATLHLEGRSPVRLRADDAVAVPPALDHALIDCTPELELLELTVPEHPNFRPAPPPAP